MQTTVAEAETSDAAESGAVYTGTIDMTPPDDFEWKPVSETKLTVTSVTEVHVSVQSKPFTDIDSFHNLDSHAAEVIFVFVSRLNCMIVTLISFISHSFLV